MKLFPSLLAVLIFTSVSAFSQNLSGRVLDEATGRPVTGATIQIAPSGITTLTDEAGIFSVRNLPGGNYTITISSIGFDQWEDKISVRQGNNSFVDVNLKSGLIKLEEVKIASERPKGQQIVNSIDIRLRPLNNSQEVLRMVPGLFIGQHAGGGKAEQIFLRGFDIDHGTDIRLTVDGMPVNMVSHAHGQGYADLHFVIPEMIERVDFSKGTYDTEKGNFSTAGWVDFRTKDVLEQNTVKLEAGQFDTYRLFSAMNILGNNARAKGQSAYVASEYNFSNSYFDSPQRFHRFNALAKYNARIGKSNFNAAVSSFWSKWNHSGQIPDRAVDSGLISFYGAIDDTEGGETARTNVNLQLTTPTGRGLFAHQAFYSHYTFELFSNFTFFLEDPDNGDQIKQKEARHLFGYNGSYWQEGHIGKLPVRTRAGINYRQDITDGSELAHTMNKTHLLNPIMRGNINEANIGLYIDEEINLSTKVTAHIGLRYDHFFNKYNDLLGQGPGGKASAGILLPKFNIFYTPGPGFQVYLKSGKSFHSNDTRVVVPEQGKRILPPAYGTDLGVNWKPLPRLFVNAAAWYLWLDQEFVYVGDAGVIEPSGKTRRQGLDLTMRYQLTDRLFADVDLNTTRPRAIGEEKGEDLIPLAPLFTSIGGLTYYAKSGLNGSIRYRYMGNRPANEDDSIVAKGYFLTDMQLNYTRPRYAIGLAVNNLLNTRWKETQFATESKLRNEPEPVEEIHFTAGSPFFARLSISFFW